MRRILALGLLLVSPGLRAQDAQEDIGRVFVQIEDIARAETGTDARSAKELERRAAALAPRVLLWKTEAIPPLSKIALDSARPLKVRVWAVSFAALIHDVSALPLLKSLMLNPGEHPILRAAAAGDIPSIGAPGEEVSRAYCAALSDKKLPPGVFHTALLYLSELGCDDAADLEWWAKRRGPNPKDAALRDVERVLSALGRSRPLEATRALFRLFDYFRSGGLPREQILRELSARKYQLQSLGGEAAHFARAAAIAEAANPPAALTAIGILADIDDRRSISLLLKLLNNPDARVVTAAAETLSKFQARQARAPLENILEKLHKDPRFTPENEPEKLAQRIAAALKALQ